MHAWSGSVSCGTHSVASARFVSESGMGFTANDASRSAFEKGLTLRADRPLVAEKVLVAERCWLRLRSSGARRSDSGFVSVPRRFGGLHVRSTL